MDGRGHYLSYVEIDFTASGDRITKMGWKVGYQEETVESRPERVQMRYHWHEYVENDTGVGFNFLMLACWLVAWGCGIVILLGADGAAKDGKMA
jgi:hypothetical protein